MNVVMGDEALEAVQRLVPIAEDAGLSMPELALAWVLRRPGQAHANAAASGIELSAGVLDAIDRALDEVPIKGQTLAVYATEGITHRGWASSTRGIYESVSHRPGQLFGLCLRKEVRRYEPFAIFRTRFENGLLYPHRPFYGLVEDKRAGPGMGPTLMGCRVEFRRASRSESPASRLLWARDLAWRRGRS